ncbi:hypothetical protein [Legionella waltersii]|uniref:Uncharacterized protein n=1 Tax=Legionella waltersii TaxID=66969 RepID=A0A0W1A1Z0_9GAMM|nr:hypothetical protein [Legionella waltersii]KTD75152.1 hypothetical protein Lwal_3193 [Legionella waltersii]SNV04793.1 Uncharacterised protein [Legionella waltersii]
MQPNQASTDDKGKTVTLIALGNTLLAPLWWVDKKIGLTAAIAGTGLFLYLAHEEGKNQRPVGNAVNGMNNFFAPITGDKSTSVSNAMNNIAVGGAAIFDQVMDPLTPKK